MDASRSVQEVLRIHSLYQTISSDNKVTTYLTNVCSPLLWLRAGRTERAEGQWRGSLHLEFYTGGRGECLTERLYVTMAQKSKNNGAAVHASNEITQDKGFAARAHLVNAATCFASIAPPRDRGAMQSTGPRSSPCIYLRWLALCLALSPTTIR